MILSVCSTIRHSHKQIREIGYFPTVGGRLPKKKKKTRRVTDPSRPGLELGQEVGMLAWCELDAEETRHPSPHTSSHLGVGDKGKNKSRQCDSGREITSWAVPLYP